MQLIRNRWSLSSWLLALVCCLCFLLGAFPVQAAPQVKVNAPAPDFTLPTLEGKEVSLSSLQGKAVLLAFWSIYCHVCRQELPKLNAIYNKYKDQGLEVVGVAIDREPAQTVREEVRKDGLSFPILLDGEKKVMKVYQARSLPVVFLLDRKGIVKDKKVGIYEWSSPASEELIANLLKKK